MQLNYLFHLDLKVVFYLASPASLQRFTFFLLGLGDLDDSAIFKSCFEYFSNDSFHMPKNIVLKNKASY